ncbi:hypothetical protein C8J56DRAFT_805275, partial [Mycena floridula]
FPGDGLVYFDNKPFTLAMFHELRCLNIIRKADVALVASETNETIEATDLGYHCMNYMRQMVLCRGDLQLDQVWGKLNPNVYPERHQCQDWTAVYLEVSKNQRSYGAV